jgi:putative transposase
MQCIGRQQRHTYWQRKRRAHGHPLGCKTRHPYRIHPAWPAAQIAYVARYNRTVRYDWLVQHLFETLQEIQEFATNWLWTYNHNRPNMTLGGITPKQKLALAA